VRTHSTATSPPPLSPRTLSEKYNEKEKKHHSRRKSGKDYGGREVREEKKHQHPRPATLSRRTTPQYVRTVGSARPREKDHLEDSGPRDSGESFPQFWYVLIFSLSLSFSISGPGAVGGGTKEGGIQEHTDWEGHRVGCRSIRIFGNEADESFSSMSCEKQFLPANNSTSYCSEK
jgi:hypothetical protein